MPGRADFVERWNAFQAGRNEKQQQDNEAGSSRTFSAEPHPFGDMDWSRQRVLEPGTRIFPGSSPFIRRYSFFFQAFPSETNGDSKVMGAYHQLRQAPYRLTRSRSQDFPKSNLFTTLFILKDMCAAAAIVPVAPDVSIRQRRQPQ